MAKQAMKTKRPMMTVRQLANGNQVHALHLIKRLEGLQRQALAARHHAEATRLALECAERQMNRLAEITGFEF